MMHSPSRPWHHAWHSWARALADSLRGLHPASESRPGGAWQISGIKLQLGSVLPAPHAVPHEVLHAGADARARGIAALPGELLALLTPSLELWLAPHASPAFLTTSRH